MEAKTKNKTLTKLTPKFIASVGILAGISVLLYYILEFPIPFIPPFLKFDFSTLPALIGGFAFGPIAGFVIVLIKALLHTLISYSGGAGEIADLLVSGSFVLVASSIYAKHKTRKHAVLGMLIGTIVMTIVGGFANYFILIPFYAKIMPLDKIMDMCGPYINSTLDYVLFGAIPFNIIKGLILSAITFVTYKHISRILH